MNIIKENSSGHNPDKYFLLFILFLAAISPVIIGPLSAYIILITSIIYFIFSLITKRNSAFNFDEVAIIFIIVFLIQIALAIITAQKLGDIFFGLNFLPLVFYLIISSNFSKSNIKNPNILLSNIAFIGTISALIVSILAIFIFKNYRATYGLVNANELSGLALLFGFLSLISLAGGIKKSNFYLFLAPIFALYTIYLTGSRGALLAFIPMAMIAVLFLTPKNLRAIFFISSSLIIGIIIALLLYYQPDRFIVFVDIFKSLFGEGKISDDTTMQRLALYQAGIQVFLQAPIFGHGWANIMSAVEPLINQNANKNLLMSLPQLHNDIINFAVTGGIIGIFTYLLILIGPIFAVFKPSNQYSIQSKMGVALLVTCYATRGLTDLMIGFEYGTTIYIVILAMLLRPRSKEKNINPYI